MSLNLPDSLVRVRGAFLPHCLLVPIFLLVACSTQRSIELPDLSDPDSRYVVLAEMDQWEFAGRIGVSAGSEGFNGKIWWRQDGTVYRARISGPLGVGTVFINGNRGDLTITDNDGVATRLENAEIDLRNRYGWTIPVESLRYWVLGVRDPELPSNDRTDEQGLINQFEQGSWSVNISEYREAAGQEMPRRLSAVSGDVKVRLVIDEWTFRE